MLLLTSTSDLVQVITGAASTINVHTSYMDNNAGTITPLRTNTATISTATTTTIVGSPASSVQRNVRHINISNTDAANSCLITVQHTDGTNVEPLIVCTLLIGEELVLTQGGLWVHYDQYGGAYQATTQSKELFNSSTASQGAGFASDTYLTGSNILLPTSRPIVGTQYKMFFQVTKTGAGTATPIISLRYGTTASTSDTALCTFTFAAGTAAADTAWWEVFGLFRSVGSGTSAVIAGISSVTTNLATTGFSNAVKNVQTTSSGFNSTTASTYLGVSVNGGTSASWTVQIVAAQLKNF
jgi:hypothetical protein